MNTENPFYDGIEGGNYEVRRHLALVTAERLARRSGEPALVYFGRPDRRIACWFVRRVSDPTPYSSYFESPMRPMATVYPTGEVRRHGG